MEALKTTANSIAYKFECKSNIVFETDFLPVLLTVKFITTNICIAQFNLFMTAQINMQKSSKWYNNTAVFWEMLKQVHL